jgi:hypothetical protein
MKPLPRILPAMLLALALQSCATGALVPDSQSMSAARASLFPEYRIFYDSLIDYGDWVLIEPYGYVFRPRVNTVAWQPYDYGFWAPTDLYGWTWISSEPFGWATYHYGSWFYDRFQGWVWVPGADWGPAWVNWTASDDYVGWAPQLARGGSYADVPNGAFRYVPVASLGSTDLSKAVTESALGEKARDTRTVSNIDEVKGVRFNRGPKIDWVEQKTGPLRRTRVQDLITPGDVATLREREKAKRAPGVAPAPASPSGQPVTTADSTQRAAQNATREARDMVNRGVVDTRVPVVRPFGVPDRTSPSARPAPASRAPKRSASDTTRTR